VEVLNDNGVAEKQVRIFEVEQNNKELN